MRQSTAVAYSLLRHYEARKRPRQGARSSGCDDAPDAGTPAVARIPVAAQAILSDRQSLKDAPSFLAGRTDVLAGGSSTGLSGLRRDGVDGMGNKTACREVGATMASWSPGPLFEALRGLRGINVVSTATLGAPSCAVIPWHPGFFSI